MRLPGRAEVADGLVGGSLSFVGGLVAGAIAYVVVFREAGAQFGATVLASGAALAIFGFLAEFVRCWIAGPRFGAIIAAFRRFLSPQGEGRPIGPAGRARRMVVAGVTAAVVVTLIWGVKALLGV